MSLIEITILGYAHFYFSKHPGDYIVNHTWVDCYLCKRPTIVTQGWYKPLDIVIYPINPGNSPIVQRYIDSLRNNSFVRIDNFISRESKKYDVITSQPTRTRLGPTLDQQPPTPPIPEVVLLIILSGA